MQNKTNHWHYPITKPSNVNSVKQVTKLSYHTKFLGCSNLPQPCKVATRLSQGCGILCKVFKTLQGCDNLA